MKKKLGTKNKRNRGLLYSMLAIGAGAAVYGLTKTMVTKNIENNPDPNYEPDNPEIFNYYY
ncbi:hypothetical protein IMZ08_15160 [Bacillus luteolus]|uniref:Uncharacterized protein n=1 Tax=Litchfieldia luteola TaxID=682179 RepID=A0ABR9QMJ0_9BACI|nr:hypothetical protein [Cytobacillus luteolus]MBE4909389.1 hypothetical protein [Cytobacillus luteolus]MBP1940788.1 hypothetical protein [Cytobacillus luteolus]